MSSFISASKVSVDDKARFYLTWLAMAVAISFALTWAYVAFLPVAYMNDTYFHSRLQKQRIAACDLGEVLVFGASRANAAIVPALLSVPVTNLAVAGTSPVETYFAVRDMLRCPNKPRLVILSNEAFMFGQPTGFWTQDSLRDFLNPGERQEVQRIAEALHDEPSIGPLPNDGLPDWGRDWFYRVHFPPLAFPSLLHAGIGLRWFHNRHITGTVQESGGYVIFGTAPGASGLTKENEADRFQVTRLEDYYFTQTLEALNQSGIRTIYLAIPINQFAVDRLPPDIATGFTTYLQDKARSFRDFHVAGDVLPCWPAEFFGDPGHLNASGARAYSIQLNTWLNAILGGGAIDGLPNRCPPVRP